MSSLLLKNVWHANKRTNILIENGIFTAFGVTDDFSADETYNADGQAILPSFHNTHTHAAMTLLRGYADDMALLHWLKHHIWPFEGQMKPQDIYDGVRLACLEMIRSGTTFFCDMYWMVEETLRATQDMGIRGAIGLALMDRLGPDQIRQSIEFLENWNDPSGGRLSVVVAPHAIYTASADLLQQCADVARRKNLKLTIHVSEIEQEVKDCIAQHGESPVRYLDRLGVLGPNVIAAHCVHLDSEEMDILRERGVWIAHNPCSNMKLSSGILAYDAMIEKGLNLTLGTDGTASNNNLDMREEMKFAALLAKSSHTPETLPAKQVFDWATLNGARAFGLNTGVIQPGALADAVLVDLNNERLTPNHNLISNWVYAADSRAIVNVLCNGRWVMKDRLVENEAEILAHAREAVRRIRTRLR